VKSAQKFFSMGGFEGSVEEDLVFFFHFVTRMGECEGEVAIVGNDKEPFAFFVEASNVVDAGPIIRDEVEDGASPGLVGRGADEAFWFVDDGVDVLLGFHGSVTDFDDVARIDGGGEGGDGLSVDAD
jgi:hypothetical protein